MYTITVLSLSLSGMYKSAILDAVFDEVTLTPARSGA